jgi:transposase
MVGLRPHQKVKKKQRIYVGIGTGDFDATGLLHISFLKYFVRKAKPLGMTILGVDEYFTSQKCVRCHEFTESLSMRAKKCSKCNVVFHRDILAADNMCAALSAILEKGERPEYLCKPPDDQSDDDDMGDKTMV